MAAASCGGGGGGGGGGAATGGGDGGRLQRMRREALGLGWASTVKGLSRRGRSLPISAASSSSLAHSSTRSPALQSTAIIPPRCDGSGRGRRSRAPPWCAGRSGTSARTRRHRNPGQLRRRGAAPATPSWHAPSAPVAVAEHLCALPAASARSSALFAPASSCGIGDGGAWPIDEPSSAAARRPCRDGWARRPERGQSPSPSSVR